MLLRLASKYEARAVPAWSQGDPATHLAPLLLVGAWENKTSADCGIVERVTGYPYANVQQNIARWLNSGDAPIRFLDGVYSFASREDSWRLLKPYLTSAHLELFKTIAIEILGEDDPRFDMPPEERYLAAIREKVPVFSPSLREGVAEAVALLGACGDNVPHGAANGATWRAAAIVRELLDAASPRRWFSISHLLPLLAEAAPDEFLSALESDLDQPSPSVTALFVKGADHFFTSSPHPHLMWALELLSWDPSYLSRVVLILLALARLDDDNRTSPRPAEVLRGIFRFWYPQTSATIDERLAVLEFLAKKDATAVWPLLLGLVPQGHDMAMSAYKPRWRNCDGSQAQNITYGDIHRQMDACSEMLVCLAGNDPAKWCDLLKHFDEFRPTTRRKIVNWFTELDAGLLSITIRGLMWDIARETVRRHRFYRDAEWALPAKSVDELAILEMKFRPEDSLERSRWLFGSNCYRAFGDCHTPYEEGERLKTEAQQQAVKEVFEAHGLAGVISLARDTQFPHVIGASLASRGVVQDWHTLLPALLQSPDRSTLLVARGYVAQRSSAEGDEWLASLPIEEWPPDAAAEVFLSREVNRKAWESLRQRNPQAETIFWERVHPYAVRLDEGEIAEATRMLLKAQRPHVAIDLLASAIHARKKPAWNLIADAVDLASLEPAGGTPSEPISQESIWNLTELMKYIDSDPTADHERVATLEWRLIGLARFDRFKPTALFGELDRNPALFADIISLCFKEKHAQRCSGEKRDEDAQNRAVAAHILLEAWTGVPGTMLDGSINDATLGKWITDVRTLCKANDRIEVCDLKIGEQLSYAPQNPDGSWPCMAVCDAIERIPGDEILRGFECGVMNQRGVTTRSLKEGGEQERSLVEQYRRHADRCRIRWPRVARALRSIAESYESRARHEDERAEGRD